MPVTVKQAKFLWRYDNLVVSSAGFIWDSSAFNFNQSHRDLQGITACISILKNRNSTAF
jgi:hypothetical protein